MRTPKKTTYVLATLAILGSLLFFCEEAVGGTPTTLREAFIAAKKQSEVLLDQDEQIKQIEEQYQETQGAALPNVTGLASITRQASAGANIFPQTQKLAKVNLTQPLFRGFKEYAAMRSSTLSKKAQEQLKRAAEKSLFNDLSQNYFLILSLEEDLSTLKTELASYNKRIQELQHRIAIGRSRETERMSVESLLANIRAKIAEDEGTLRVARETFAFLTGMSSSTPLVNEKIKVDLAPLDSYLQSKQPRSEIQAAQLKLQAAEENSKVAERTLYPSLDFLANYYFLRNGPQDALWDIGLTLSVSIYDGGILRSQKRRALSQQTQASNELQLARRKNEQEIRASHETVKSDIDQMTEYKSAYAIAKENVQALQNEYSRGLASNLEVLQAMSTLDEALRNYKKSEFVIQSDFVKLTAFSETNELLRN